MNNSDNNETKVNDFDAISLGSVQDGNSEPVNPIPVVTPNVEQPVVMDVPKVPSPEPVAEIKEEVVPEPLSDVAPEVKLEDNAPITPDEPTVDVVTPPIDPIQSVTESNGGIGIVPPVNPTSTVGDLTSSAGGIVPPVQPVEPVKPVEPVEPLNYDVPESLDSFNPSPLINEIGAVPPIPDIPEAVQSPNAGKGKKSVNKTLFVLIIVLALTAVGVGVYIFLHLGQNANKPVVLTKKVNLEIGSDVSVDITDYATFKNVDKNTCELDTTEITDTSKLGAEYKFKITCNDTTYTGTLNIVDTVKPEVIVKEVKVQVEGDVKPEDFIQECNDATKCTYAFKDEKKVKENLKVASSYKVELVISDEAGNEVEKEAVMVVDDNLFVEASMYLVAKKDTDLYREEIKFGIEDGEFTKSVLKNYIFNLTAEEYNNLKTANENKNKITYKNITGKPKFLEDNSLVISVIVSMDDLNKEENTTLPLVIADLNEYYTQKGYECSYGF